MLFHEKPFAGINGNGKHANWSVGTDTGLNFFYPKTYGDERDTIYTTALACLSHGLLEYNELVRCSVAHAGNDHRLGRPGGAAGYHLALPGHGLRGPRRQIDWWRGRARRLQARKRQGRPAVPRRGGRRGQCEDRNRTAPFPFCGNRFEFRACGSSQNCALPMTVCNTLAGSPAWPRSRHWLISEGGASQNTLMAAGIAKVRH